MRALILLPLLGCDGGKSSGVPSLDTCTTELSDEVPAFYRTYFHCVTASMDGDQVLLESDGLPPHASPYYPEDDPGWVQWDDLGEGRFQNPNELTEQAHALRLDVDPVPRGLTIIDDMVDQTAGTSTDEYGGMGVLLGLALDGVALFHGVAAPGDDIDDERWTFDAWEAHPENTGIYHHHSANPGGLAVLEYLGFTDGHTPGEESVELYGLMCDGTAVLGCTELDGREPDDADLDAQNGHVHDLTDGDGAVMLEGRYHVHLCEGRWDRLYTPEIQYYEGCG